MYVGMYAFIMHEWMRTYMYVRKNLCTYLRMYVFLVLCIQASQFNETKKITTFNHLWGRGYGAQNTNTGDTLLGV